MQSRQRPGRLRTATRAGVVLLTLAFLPGCVTVAEYRKLEKQVIDLQRARSSSHENEQLAEAAASIDELGDEIRQLQGRLEVVERTAADALGEARRARREATVSQIEAEDALAGEAGDEPALESQDVSEEVQTYRAAYGSWRNNEYDVCIDRFRKFLQTYPASPYADDAAFWMADCHFRQGDYKNAVLRFDDVVRNYPDGNKAPEALYRQGESLLKLGPGFHPAARRAFERVLKEYPDSARAREAQQQLELVKTG